MNAPTSLLKNILADRDPQLAIVYVLVIVSIAFPGEEEFSSMRGCFHGWAHAARNPN